MTALQAPGVPHSALDEPRRRGLVGENVTGFTGLPGLEGYRTDDGRGAWAPRLRAWTWSVADPGADLDASVRLTAAEAGWDVVEVELTREGLVRMRTGVTNSDSGELVLQAVRSALPVAPRATELLDLTGRWCRERTPQRRPWLLGTHVREGRHGRTGHDASLVLAAGRPGSATGSPRAYAVTRPVPGSLVRCWSTPGEATYFNHDPDGLMALADAAAAVGVERSVLDDGWFRGRRTDRAGLGDWTVDTKRWPGGLHPLVDHVHGLGMDFGLWVEPEMVNEDSDLAREHPDWILRGRQELPGKWRHQQVLALQVPEAYAHVRDALQAPLDEYDIAFLKWDHNRDLVDVAHRGRPAVHGQTVAFYRLLGELRRSHPALEIETCASGGGRIDLEVLTRTDRVWPSDTIDAVERQRIQRWTSLVVPPEMMGAHVGGPVAATTGCSQPLPFRASTALLGHLGIEWDLRALDDAERTELAAWVAGAGRSLVRRRNARQRRDPGSGPVLLCGLDPERSYRLTVETPPGCRHPSDLGETWLDGPGMTVSGSTLSTVGVGLPALAPETAIVLRVSAHA